MVDGKHETKHSATTVESPYIIVNPEDEVGYVTEDTLA